MSNPIPNLLALTSIADGSPQQAAPLRNNYAAIQAAVNALATALKGGTAGALFYATDASDVAYLPDAPNDGDALVWNAAASRWKPVASASGAGAELDSVQITADIAGITATTEGTAVTVITGTSKAYDATKKNIEVCIPNVVVTAGTPTKATVVVLRGATVVGQFVLGEGAGGGGGIFSGACFRVQDTPGAATFSYVVKVFVDSGTVTVKAGAGGSGNLFPAHLIVTKA